MEPPGLSGRNIVDVSPKVNSNVLLAFPQLRGVNVRRQGAGPLHDLAPVARESGSTTFAPLFGPRASEIRYRGDRQDAQHLVRAVAQAASGLFGERFQASGEGVVSRQQDDQIGEREPIKRAVSVPTSVLAGASRAGRVAFPVGEAQHDLHALAIVTSALAFKRQVFRRLVRKRIAASMPPVPFNSQLS
jgi:hypothetical protein